MRPARELNESPLPARALRLLLLAGAVSLLAAGWLLIRRADGASRPTVGSDSFSRSGLGHMVLRQTLAALDVPLLVSRHATLQRAGPGTLLVFAEPTFTAGDELFDELRELDAPGAAALVVLPRRRAETTPADRGRLHRAGSAPVEDVERVLEWIGIDAGIVRSRPQIWHSSLGVPDPTLAEPQLMRGFSGRRLIWGEDGVLLGSVRLGAMQLYVLSDPDLIANHGIVDGDNAAVVVRALQELCAGERMLVLDETLHGHAQAPSVWAELGRYPLLLLPLHLLLVAALVLWAAPARFGAPLRARPAIAAGKAFLIENIAGLLAMAGPSADALRRYARARLQLVLVRMQAPDSLAKEQRLAWVAARARGCLTDDDWQWLADMLRAPGDAATRASWLDAARRIHRLTKELLRADR